MDFNYCTFCKKAETINELFDLKSLDQDLNIDLLTISYEVLNFLRVGVKFKTKRLKLHLVILITKFILLFIYNYCFIFRSRKDLLARTVE